jgi:hypothetical protein
MVDPHLQHPVSLLPKATAFPDDFDLVAVGIGDEEELREGGAVMLENHAAAQATTSPARNRRAQLQHR